jgi:hypothetical protein
MILMVSGNYYKVFMTFDYLGNATPILFDTSFKLLHSGIYLKLIQRNQNITTCYRLHSVTLGFRPIMHKNLPGHRSGCKSG